MLSRRSVFQSVVLGFGAWVGGAVSSSAARMLPETNNAWPVNWREATRVCNVPLATEDSNPEFYMTSLDGNTQFRWEPGRWLAADRIASGKWVEVDKPTWLTGK